jgi:hypothetical protein
MSIYSIKRHLVLLSSIRLAVQPTKNDIIYLSVDGGRVENVQSRLLNRLLRVSKGLGAGVTRSGSGIYCAAECLPLKKSKDVVRRT